MQALRIIVGTVAIAALLLLGSTTTYAQLPTYVSQIIADDDGEDGAGIDVEESGKGVGVKVDERGNGDGVQIKEAGNGDGLEVDAAGNGHGINLKNGSLVLSYQRYEIGTIAGDEVTIDDDVVVAHIISDGDPGSDYYVYPPETGTNGQILHIINTSDEELYVEDLFDGGYTHLYGYGSISLVYITDTELDESGWFPLPYPTGGFLDNISPQNNDAPGLSDRAPARTRSAE